MTLKYNIICTEKYLLIVDDSQITEGDWHIKINKNKVGNYPLDSVNPNKGRYKKIIAHLPLNGASILDGVDLLSPLEDEAEVMAEEYSKNYYYDNAQDDVYHGFFQGYNKAKEQFRYTEEDLRNAIHFGKFGEYNGQETTIGFIQYLQQPKMPVGFNLEAKDTYIKNGILVKTQWVGKYIY
jgi:hypothetical protein